MANVHAAQEILRKSPTLAGAFAAMWREGVRLLQSEPEWPSGVRDSWPPN